MKQPNWSTKYILEQHKEKSDKVNGLKDALYKLHPINKNEYPDTDWANDPRDATKAVFALYTQAVSELKEFEETNWIRSM